MNKSYVSVLTKIVRLLDKKGVKFETVDSFSGGYEWTNVDGREILTNDDTDREQWYTRFEYESLKDYKEIFTEVFGAPEKVHTGVHEYDVLNWTINKNLIVLGENGVEVFRDYTKR